MSISAHFQQVSSRREGQSTKTRVGRSLTCCNEESIEVLGLQSAVGGDQRRPGPVHLNHPEPKYSNKIADTDRDYYMGNFTYTNIRIPVQNAYTLA